MRIVIAGAGEVGTHLATLLNRDKHDIVLITEDEQTYNSACSKEDLLKVAGSPTSIAVLKEANIENCRLFVAVTPDESRNMTSCMVAKKLGAEITVARVDTMEYMEEENQQFFLDKGISSLIYPELLVANEINHLIARPWARHWWEMQCGKLLLWQSDFRNLGSRRSLPHHGDKTQWNDDYSSRQNANFAGRFGVCDDGT